MSSPDIVSVLVTGGAGFVGSSILETIQKHEPTWKLYSLDLPGQVGTIPDVTYLTGSVTSPAEVRTAMATARPTVVMAVAGIVPPLGQRYGRKLQDVVYGVNIGGSQNVLEAAQEIGSCRAFVLTSSCCAVFDDMKYAYPNADETWLTSKTGSTIYGESKARTEPIVLGADDAERGFRTCALRPSVLFGPEDYQLIPSIHACIAKFETPFVIGTGLNFWDVTDVRNVAWSHLLAAKNLLSDEPTAGGEAFFIANDEPVPFRHFCLEVWKHFGHHPPFEVTIPEGVAKAIAGAADFLGNWLGLPVTLSSGSVGDACAMRYCDGVKARKLLGYKPIIGIEEGIRESCERLKERIASGDAYLRKDVKKKS